MSLGIAERLRVAFAPPRYLLPRAAGIDISLSSIKAITLASTSHGPIVDKTADVRLPSGAFSEGEVTNRPAVVQALREVMNKTGADSAHISLPESKSYLFETTAPGKTKREWRTGVEQHLDELIPLPPEETSFDVVRAGKPENGEQPLAGVGFARRVVDETLSVFDEAGLTALSLESETFSTARALLPHGDDSTVLIIDLGRTTTKITIVAGRVPRFATTINIGGHALTLAVQKHFGVTEAEARKIKIERGIVSAPGNEDYIAAMLSTVSAIKDEIERRLDYWQSKEALSGKHEPVSRAILAGGNASVRGLPEYLEGVLHIPVSAGDVFVNLAPRAYWLPEFDYAESLAYATVIGLALRSYVP